MRFTEAAHSALVVRQPHPQSRRGDPAASGPRDLLRAEKSPCRGQLRASRPLEVNLRRQRLAGARKLIHRDQVGAAHISGLQYG